MNVRRLRNLLYVAPLWAAFAAAAPAQLVQAYHDADDNTHQANFDNLSNQGFRMIALTIYGSTNDLRYAAVWIQRNGPPFRAFHGLDSTAYQNWVDTWTPQGFVPRILSATGSGGNARYAGVFEQTNVPNYLKHGLTQQAFWDEIDDARDLGLQIRTADVYGTNNDPRYIVGFVQSDAGRGVVVSNGTTDYQTQFDAMVSGYSRPTMVAFNDSNRFLSFWENDSVGGQIAHHDMTAAEYQANFDNYALQHLYPITMSASGSGSSRRFAAVWAATDIPVPRQFSATGQVVPELIPFDNYVQNWMQQNDARAAALAIVKDARLVFARGYRYAEPGYPATQPTSLFRIASCTKPLTSIAVHQHYDRMPAAIWPQRAMLNFFPGYNPFDPRQLNITIDRLLTHEGGWDRNVSFDPMFQDETISSTMNVPIPIGKGDVFDYMTLAQTLDFMPGTQSKYSNYGYSIVGQVLEQLNNGQPYAQIMQRDVFGPLGITRAQIGRAHVSQAFPTEVRYHPKNAWVAQSVNTAQRPWVSGTYGGYNFANMDSHGSWVMAAPDYAKVLAAFDLGAANPLLPTGQVTDMWTVAPNTNTTLRGWFLRNVDDGKGGTTRMFHHNGKLPGAASVIAHREDGISFVFFTNSDTSMSGNVEGQQLSDLANGVSIWPNHDLFPTVGLRPFRSHVPGSAQPYGRSCGGTAAPMTLGGSGTPEVGQAFALELRNAPAGRPAVALLGFARSALDLSRVGAPGCALYCVPADGIGTTTGRSGSARIGMVVPDDRNVLGLHVYAQFAVLDPRSNTLGVTTTNGLDVLFGGWR